MIKINYFIVDGEVLDTQSIEEEYGIDKFKILGKYGYLKQNKLPLEFDIDNHHFKYDRTELSEKDTRPSASTNYYEVRKEIEVKPEKIKNTKLSSTELFTKEERLWLNRKKLEFIEKYF